MEYKNFTHPFLNNSLKNIFEEKGEYDQYSPEQWVTLLNNLLNNRKSDKFDDDDLKNLCDYLHLYSCDEALEKYIDSEVPITLCSFIVFFVKNKMAHTSIKDKNKIAKNKQLIRCLFLINEAFKVHNLFDFELINDEIIDSFFYIYEFSDLQSSDFSISIITRYAEHSQDNLEYLNLNFNFKKRVMDKLGKKQKLVSVYAFFPFLNDDNTYQNIVKREISIIEFLMYLQEKHKENYETLLPILQFYNIYMNYSDKCLQRAVQLQGIDLIMSALTTETSCDEEFISCLKQTAVDMIILILNSQFDEYKYIIIEEKNILKNTKILLTHGSDYDNIAACQLLFFLITENHVAFDTEECIDDLIKIISDLYQSLELCCFDVKMHIFKVFSVLLNSGNESIISNICENGVLNDMIDLIENVDDEIKLFILNSLYYLIQNFEESLDFFDQEEAINVFGNMNEKSQNEDVLMLSQSITNLLTQD